MAEKDVRLLEIYATHKVEGCKGIMVPKFIFLTSDHALRVVGYCINCGQGMHMEDNLAELDKMCPSSHDSNFKKELEPPVQSTLKILEDFELPPGGKLQ